MPPAAFNWDICLQHAALTDVGMRRANNQDAHTVVPADDVAMFYERGHFFMVADGMGAHAAGELASKLAVETVPHLYYKHRDMSPPEALRAAIIEANSEVHRRGQANPEFHDMGTTVCSLVLLPQGALVGHIGDSRAYRLRNHVLEQLTFDHSLVWELKQMQAEGQLPADSELVANAQKNVITRSLGPSATVKVDIEGPFPTEVGDTFLLCSDGLSGQLNDEELGALLENLPPEQAVRTMVDLANLRGGPDNITVIVARVTGPQITTAVAGGEPLTVGREKAKSVHPAIWGAAGVLLLVAIVLTITEHPFIALGAAICGVLVLLAGLLMQFSDRTREISLGNGRKLGKGPHTHVACPDGSVFAGQLRDAINQLLTAAEREHWQVDRPKIDQLLEQADRANGERKFPQALRGYSQAITLFMKQIRGQRRKKQSDSTVDL